MLRFSPSRATSLPNRFVRFSQRIASAAIDHLNLYAHSARRRTLAGPGQILGQAAAWPRIATSPGGAYTFVHRDAVDADQLIAMMLEQPRLIRRPLTVVDGELLSAKSGVDAIMAAVEGKIRAVGAS